MLFLIDFLSTSKESETREKLAIENEETTKKSIILKERLGNCSTGNDLLSESKGVKLPVDQISFWQRL
jgi:hypothetical protein